MKKIFILVVLIVLLYNISFSENTDTLKYKLNFANLTICKLVDYIDTYFSSDTLIRDGQDNSKLSLLVYNPQLFIRLNDKYDAGFQVGFGCNYNLYDTNDYEFYCNWLFTEGIIKKKHLFTSDLTGYLGLGMAWWEAKRRNITTNTKEVLIFKNIKQSEIVPCFNTGVGYDFRLSDNVFLKLDIQWHKLFIDKNNYRMLWMPFDSILPNKNSFSRVDDYNGSIFEASIGISYCWGSINSFSKYYDIKGKVIDMATGAELSAVVKIDNISSPTNLMGEFHIGSIMFNKGTHNKYIYIRSRGYESKKYYLSGDSANINIGEIKLKKMPEGIFRGVVRDDKTGIHLGGVMVSCVSGNDTIKDMTDNNGCYELKLSLGRYFITYEHPNYIIYNETIDMNMEQAIVKNLALLRKGERYVINAQNIFEGNTAKMKGHISDTLIQLKKYMKKTNSIKIKIESYADINNDYESSMLLSKLRSKILKQWFVDSDIDAERVTAESYGNLNPIDNENNVNNQRMEITVY